MTAVTTKSQYDQAVRVTKELTRRRAAGVLSALAERAVHKTSARAIAAAYELDSRTSIDMPSAVTRMLAPVAPREKKTSTSKPNAFTGTSFRRASARGRDLFAKHLAVAAKR